MLYFSHIYISRSSPKVHHEGQKALFYKGFWPSVLLLPHFYHTFSVGYGLKPGEKIFFSAKKAQKSQRKWGFGNNLLLTFCDRMCIIGSIMRNFIISPENAVRIFPKKPENACVYIIFCVTNYDKKRTPVSASGPQKTRFFATRK